MLLPGLLAAGIGSLIFIGLDNLTGLGTFSLALQAEPGNICLALPCLSFPVEVSDLRRRLVAAGR